MALILKSAFGLDAGFGAVIGLAVQWGVKRGVYSNEAGQGTGPHAAAAAEVSHPAKQGYVQAFSIYVDTLLVCSATAFMILCTGKYNVANPDGSMIVKNLPGVAAGPAYTQAAVETVLPGFGATFVALALMFFAFTTIVAYYYMAETNVQYINRYTHRPWITLVLQLHDHGLGRLRRDAQRHHRLGPGRYGCGPDGMAQHHRHSDLATACIEGTARLRGAEEAGARSGV